MGVVKLGGQIVQLPPQTVEPRDTSRNSSKTTIMGGSTSLNTKKASKQPYSAIDELKQFPHVPDANESSTAAPPPMSAKATLLGNSSASDAIETDQQLESIGTPQLDDEMQ